MDWHDIRDPQDAELDRLAARYHLHPLHIEDCRHRNQSAKVEESPGYLFAVLKLVTPARGVEIEIDDLDIFLGRDFIITVHPKDCEPARRFVDQVRAACGEMRADQAFYRIMDAVVDSYLPLLDRFNEEVDELEDLVLENPEPKALARIFTAKRAMITLRRVLVNTRDVAGHLQRTESDLIRRDMWPFLRDVYDHVARNLDLIEMQRDLLTGALDIYLSSVANRTNQVMKVLTVVGTIALPMIVISSYYGMNMKGLPWIDSPNATWIVTGIMAGTTVVLMIILRWFRWF
ncbi:MAG: magnesium transporter CorA family protein [Candidatus Solibacter usitatus]|nr:magnesium transporter CorA family protein [Candidatus Solibacter usitatus]